MPAYRLTAYNSPDRYFYGSDADLEIFTRFVNDGRTFNLYTAEEVDESVIADRDDVEDATGPDWSAWVEAVNADRCEIYADGARGVYIPQHFAESVNRSMVTGVSEEDYAILETGPDHELYWDTWDDVMQSAVVTTADGHTWTLWQDGDLWLLRDDFLGWGDDQ